MWSYLLFTGPKKYKRICLDFRGCQNFGHSVIIRLRTTTWFVAFFSSLCSVFHQIFLNDLILLTFIYCYSEGIYRPIMLPWDVLSLFWDYINLASSVSSFKSEYHFSETFFVLSYRHSDLLISTWNGRQNWFMLSLLHPSLPLSLYPSFLTCPVKADIEFGKWWLSFLFTLS